MIWDQTERLQGLEDALRAKFAAEDALRKLVAPYSTVTPDQYTTRDRVLILLQAGDMSRQQALDALGAIDEGKVPTLPALSGEPLRLQTSPTKCSRMKVPKKRRGVSRQSAFLAAFALCGRISKAADAAGHERDLHYRWLKDDPDYPALFAEAKARAVDAFEDEAKRRAVEGVFEPTTHQGAFVYPVIGYRRDAKGRFDPTKPIHSKTPYGVMKLSDRLLEFLLRGAKPETYWSSNGRDLRAWRRTYRAAARRTAERGAQAARETGSYARPCFTRSAKSDSS